MREEEEQFRKIQNSYNSFTFMFYESNRKSGTCTKKEAKRQAEKVVQALESYIGGE